MTETNEVIALEARLRGCKNVKTLGVRTNFSDYDTHEAGLIREAKKIYYPTTFYADLFDAMGKRPFRAIIRINAFRTRSSRQPCSIC